MSTIRLQYVDYIHDREEQVFSGTIGKVRRSVLKSSQGRLDLRIEPGFCAYCRRDADIVRSHSSHDALGVDLYQFGTLWHCAGCGWWEAQTVHSEEKDYIEEVDGYQSVDRYHAVAKAFDLRDKDAPLSALAREIFTSASNAIHTNARRFEELAQAVIRDFYECEVRHVGRSHDGGVDLVMIQSNEPVLIQVKRRQTTGYVESISTVRDLLGAMVIKGASRGAIVSTAERFSRSSQTVVDDLIESGKVKQFDLIDIHSFLAMLSVTGTPSIDPWQEIVREWK